MIKSMIAAATIGTVSIFSVVQDFQKEMPLPVEICKEDPRLTEVRKALKILGRDEKFARDIFVSATTKNISPLLWVANVELESEFKITAKSRKGYKGLTQTPKAVMKTGFEIGDLVYGACVLDEKIKLAGGDIRLAMQLYKGGRNPAARKEADKVFVLYEKLKLKVKEQV